MRGALVDGLREMRDEDYYEYAAVILKKRDSGRLNKDEGARLIKKLGEWWMNIHLPLEE
ncbi:hypothetical protein D3C81_1991850 [compost metagenome]